MIFLLYMRVFFFLRHVILSFQYKEFLSELFDLFSPPPSPLPQPPKSGNLEINKLWLQKRDMRKGRRARKAKKGRHLLHQEHGCS